VFFKEEVGHCITLLHRFMNMHQDLHNCTTSDHICSNWYSHL